MEGIPDAEAVAIRNGRIVHVDTSAEVERLRGPETRILQASGAVVVPGHDRGR